MAKVKAACSASSPVVLVPIPPRESAPAGEHERAGVQDHRQGRHPRLVLVLRAVGGEQRVGEVGFQQLRRPLLPLGQDAGEPPRAAVGRVAEEQGARAGRRAGVRVEQRDAHLAARDGLVEHRQVADDQREHAEASADLNDRDGARGSSVGDYIAQAEREEGGAAEIEVGPESSGCGGSR